MAKEFIICQGDGWVGPSSDNWPCPGCDNCYPVPPEKKQKDETTLGEESDG